MVTDTMSPAEATAPPEGGRPTLPRRNGAKTLLPSTWLNRTVKLEYRGACGYGRETSGTLLDLCPLGLILNLRGARTIIAWEAIVLVELGAD